MQMHTTMPAQHGKSQVRIGLHHMSAARRASLDIRPSTSIATLLAPPSPASAVLRGLAPRRFKYSALLVCFVVLFLLLRNSF